MFLYPAFKGLSFRLFIRIVKISNKLKKQEVSVRWLGKQSFRSFRPQNLTGMCSATEEFCNLLLLYGISRF